MSSALGNKILRNFLLKNIFQAVALPDSYAHLLLDHANGFILQPIAETENILKIIGQCFLIQ